MKVVGYRNVSYTSKKTGKEVNGVEIYGTYPSNNVVGEATGKEFLSQYIIEKHNGILPDVGDEFDVSFNRFGQIDHYTITPR